MLARAEPFDAVVVFVKYQDLASSPDLDWRGYAGLRVLLEHDALTNYTNFSPERKGTFPVTFDRHGFDLLVTSGNEVAHRLRDEGLHAAWLPKGYDDRVFYNRGGRRAGACTFGTLYPAREALARYLKRREISIAQVAAPYLELGHELNEYLACVVCNMDGVYPRGVAGRVIRRIAPGAAVRVRPGLEPMIKNFEAAAAGCAVFTDWNSDLEALGFFDRETAIFYRSFDELAERLPELLGEPEVLRATGERASKLCSERHTWAHRAQDLNALIENALTV